MPFTQKAPFDTGLLVFGMILVTRPSSPTVISEPHLEAHSQQVLATVTVMMTSCDSKSKRPLGSRYRVRHAKFRARKCRRHRAAALHSGLDRRPLPGRSGLAIGVLHPL
jgi:hypothetical protein